MLLGNLLKLSNKIYQKIHVKGIAFDSRKVKKKRYFFCNYRKKNDRNKIY